MVSTSGSPDLGNPFLSENRGSVRFSRFQGPNEKEFEGLVYDVYAAVAAVGFTGLVCIQNLSARESCALPVWLQAVD